MYFQLGHESKKKTLGLEDHYFFQKGLQLVDDPQHVTQMNFNTRFRFAVSHGNII